MVAPRCVSALQRGFFHAPRAPSPADPSIDRSHRLQPRDGSDPMRKHEHHLTSHPRQIRQRTAGLVRANEALAAETRERRRVDRARRALSHCNQALIRAHDEPQFLRELCRVIVEVAGYRLCWVGYAEQDEAKTVRPVAHAGYEEGYLETVRVTWADTERGRGPTGRAVRTRAPAVFRDVTRDPDFAPWRAEALRRGYASVIGIPLLSGPEVLGALTIYAAEPEAFDEDEAQLLRELADDLSYGIVALRTRARASGRRSP